MSKEQAADLASKATAGSNVLLVAIATLGWNTMQSMEKKLDAHMAQTTKIVEALERRVESIEKRIGAGNPENWRSEWR
jgi:hypothetical protein